MKILITGSGGQLGSEIQKNLSKRKIEFLALDKFKLDINNLKKVKEIIHNYRPEIVINCAAYTNVDICEKEEMKAFSVNAIGAKNISVVSNKIGAKVIYISTDYVFDGNANKPYKENDITNPLNIYGKSKLLGEEFTKKYNPKHFIIRTSWLYGKGKNFARTMLDLSREKKEIHVVNDQVGTPTSVVDLANAIVFLSNTTNYGIYHGTCEGYCSWYDFAKKIFEVLDMNIRVTPIETKSLGSLAIRPKYSVLDNYALNKLGVFKFRFWEETLKEYLRREV